MAYTVTGRCGDLKTVDDNNYYEARLHSYM